MKNTSSFLFKKLKNMNIKNANGRLEFCPLAPTNTKPRVGGAADGILADDLTTYRQVFTSSNQTFSGSNTYSGANTWTGVNTYSGLNVHTGRETFSGGVVNSGATMYAGFFPLAAQNNITAGTGGAVSVSNYLTTINTDAGGDAFTLAAGTQPGQMKKILLVVDGGGDGTLTLTGYTSITFNDANDYVILMWFGTAWAVVENSGCTVV